MSRDAVPVYQLSGPLEPDQLEQELPALTQQIPDAYFQAQRWFGSKGKTVTHAHLKDAGVLKASPGIFLLCLVELGLESSDHEVYFLPLSLREADGPTPTPDQTLLKLKTNSQEFWIVDGFDEEDFRQALFRQIALGEPVLARHGRYTFGHTQILADFIGGGSSYPLLTSRRIRGEQSNTSVVYGNNFILKGFRRLQNGPNPDLEVPLFITTNSGFTSIPLMAGYVEYWSRDGFHASVSAMQKFIVNQGDGWQYTLGHLSELYQRILESTPDTPLPTTLTTRRDIVKQLSETYLRSARHLGQITAGMHQALAVETDNPDFAAEPITEQDINAWVSSMQTFAIRVLAELERASPRYPAGLQEQIRQVSQNQSVYLNKIQGLRGLTAQRVSKTRHHGDYHLGQTLKTTDSFVILDFEGEPARPLAERRAKHCVLRDVGGMLRSFNYAAWTGALDFASFHQVDIASLEPWAEAWERLAADAFMAGYLEAAPPGQVSFLPESRASVEHIVSVFQLDKAIYEVLYELNNRPDWLHLPLRYLLRSAGAS
jgi:maltose alpha-D-glucosyltransferase/alpha-amylase